jgi:hypothetical protein
LIIFAPEEADIFTDYLFILARCSVRLLLFSNDYLWSDLYKIYFKTRRIRRILVVYLTVILSAWFLFSGDLNTSVDFSDFIFVKIYSIANLTSKRILMSIDCSSLHYHHHFHGH